MGFHQLQLRSVGARHALSHSQFAGQVPGIRCAPAAVLVPRPGSHREQLQIWISPTTTPERRGSTRPIAFPIRGPGSWHPMRPCGSPRTASWQPPRTTSDLDFTNYNSGASGLDTPYRIPNSRARFLASDAPLRQSSYRVLAATANNFAREAFTDELAQAAGKDPLEFRLAHLDNERMRNVLNAAAQRFGWKYSGLMRMSSTSSITGRK